MRGCQRQKYKGIPNPRFMARNTRRSRGKKKMEPAVLRMSFDVVTDFTGSPTVQYLDLSLAASLINRRFYRQGLNWAVAGIKLTANGTGSVLTSKVPETWSVSNGWHKSFLMWQKMNDQVLDNEPGIQGRYSDFKIYADSEMVGAEIQQDGYTGVGPFVLTPIDSGANLTKADFTGAVSPRADWEYSQLTIPNDPVSGTSTDYYLHMVGPSGASKGVIEGYARSRARPQSQDPNVPTNSGWMTELFDVGEQLEELRDVIENDNDRAPYAVSPEQTSNEFYPGGAQEYPALQLVEFSEFTSTTVSGTNHVAGGMFPCGLIRLDINNDPSEDGGFSNLLIQVDLVPGNHRGYLCEPMQDM